MAVGTGRIAMLVLGLTLLAGCGGPGNERAKEAAEPADDLAETRQAKEPTILPQGPVEMEPGSEAAEPPVDETAAPQPDAARQPAVEIKPPTSQSLTLQDALRGGTIDRETFERVEAELQSLAEARAASPQAGGPPTEEEIEEKVAKVLRELSAPRELPSPNQLPPILIRVRANEDGSFKDALLGARRFAGIQQLSLYLRGILGDQSHLESMSEGLAIELDCEPELRSAHLVGLLEGLGGVLRGNGVARFARGLREVPYPQLYVFSIAQKPTSPATALAVSVQMTAKEDGSLGEIRVQKEIELGGDLKRLGRTLAEVIEVAERIAKAKGTDLKVRVNLDCDGRLRSGYVPAVIGILGRYDLLKSVDSLELVELNVVGGPRVQHRVSLRNLRQSTPDEMVFEEEIEELEEFEELEGQPLEELDLSELDRPVELVEDHKGPPAVDKDAAAIEVELKDLGPVKAPREESPVPAGAYTRGPLSGRGSAKGSLVEKYGGSAASEKAVATALKWLAEHQMPDGGWSFDHASAPKCDGRCQNPGSSTKARNAATAMAMLPLLGAGQTHKEGKYKETVKRGLYFLVSRMKVDPNGGSLHESDGTMYSHGLASIALCEAYAMTHDKGLHQPAQAAVNFICYAQDPVGGGWRYQPRQKGDTSVTGWQITALKSGHMAYLRIPPVTVKKAFLFLDSVQSDSGAHYGYTGPAPEKRASTTAIGLLCRMYLGWKKDNPALQKGVKWLGNQGPSKANFYYNYYATQVMRHWEGDEWKKWNSVMRDQLVNSQATEGHEAGSWYLKGDHGSSRGGRLYCTSMAAMILEVYYRHLPIYGRQAVEEAFPE